MRTNDVWRGGALALAVAAGMTLAAPARADTWHSTCVQGDCLRLRCNDADRSCVRRTDAGDTHAALRRLEILNSAYRAEAQPERYACDTHGGNCHWTRRYHIDVQGSAVFDPAMNEYP